MLRTNSSLFLFKIANEHSEFRNYLIIESIYRQITGERYIQAYEYDECLFQLTVLSTFFNEVQVNHALIVSGMFTQIFLQCYLHLDVIYGIRIIFQIYIKSYAFAIISLVYRFLAFGYFNILNFNSKDQFYQFLT